MGIKLWLIIAFLGVSSVAGAEEGFATYYTTKSCQSEGNSGLWTASGQRFDEGEMTCAKRTREWGKVWAVYGHETGKTAYVKNNDYGPGKGPTAKGVIIDLTPRAFKDVCGELALGKCRVSVQEVK